MHTRAAAYRSVLSAARRAPARYGFSYLLRTRAPARRARPKHWLYFSPRTPTASRKPRELRYAAPAPNPQVLFAPLHPPAYPQQCWAPKSLACSRTGTAWPWAFLLSAYVWRIARMRRRLRRAAHSRQDSTTYKKTA